MNYPDKIDLILTYKNNREDVDFFEEIVYAVRVDTYYQVINVPAFAPNLAFGDIVDIEVDNGKFYFHHLIKESGHTTLHVVIFDLLFKPELIDRLEEFGCGINDHIADNYLVLDIDPETNYPPIYTYLFAQEATERISFRESCLSETHKLTT